MKKLKAKKIAALLLAAAMTLSLVACGGSDATTQTAADAATEETAEAPAEDAE